MSEGLGGLGKQETYAKVRERIDAGAPPPDESRRRKEPTAAELADPLLAECRRLHLAFRASKPRDWGLLAQRSAACSAAEEAGHSLRAIARVMGVSHPTVRNDIYIHRGGYSRQADPEPWPDW